MTCAQFPPSPARSVGEGGAKRRMRAGALERDGASGKTAPLRFAALIRPSGTFSHASAWEKGKSSEGGALNLAPMPLTPLARGEVCARSPIRS